MTTTSRLAQAIRTARESRKMRDEAFRLRNNPQGRRERNKLADDLWVKTLWLTGRISGEQYGEYLNGK